MTWSSSEISMNSVPGDLPRLVYKLSYVEVKHWIQSPGVPFWYYGFSVTYLIEVGK